ncbi:MAG: MG2 domain-containing protein, partial [Bacteroidia bacterium]
MKTRKTFTTIKAAGLTIATMSLLAWITPSNYYQAAMDNDLIKFIKKKLTEYNEVMPEDRVYLQFDKPFYEPGDDIWFSAYVRDGVSMKPSNKSDIVHIELIDPKGSVAKKINIIAKNGKAAGDFSIDKEAAGGMYKVRAYTNWMKNEGEKNAFEKELQVQDVVLPNLKMKLDFEKKAFGAGDEVIAKLELNTNENKPLSDHKIKFVANLDGQKIVEQADVTDVDGIKYIKFNLPKNLKTNDGLLNVMIDYNGNTESVSRSIPIVLNTIKFTLFPEGGDLVCGLDNNVAFRALNEFGKPADVEGVVLTGKGSRVASFGSYHMGMGAFKFTPQPGEKYTVKITKPEGIAETYVMPEPLQRGYAMSIDNSKQGEVAVNVNTTENEELALVAQVRGKVYYSTLIDAKEGSNKFVFSTANFPIGVSQITLFDSKGIARAERLAFVNKDKHLNISIETEKEKYLPREKVKMLLTVKDERGLPMPANLSLSVVNDQLLSFADDKSGNILSQLLLQQDLKEKVEEPAFYFNDKEKKADKALDYLLMTSGWRRFSWEKVMDENPPMITYQGERAIVGGIIYDSETGKPMQNAKIKIANGVEYETDSNGRFTIKKLDLTSPATLIFNMDGYNAQSQYVQDYNQNMVVYMYKKYYYNYGYIRGGRGKAMSMPMTAASGMAMAEDVDVAGAVGGPPKRALENEKAPVFKEIDQLKKAEVKHGGKADGKKRELARNVDDNKRLDIPEQQKAEEKSAKVAQSKNALGVKDKRFAAGEELEADEMFNAQPVNVYYRARQFYAPDYGKQAIVETRTDFRNTIYWNPNVEVNSTGKKSIEFYTSDDITSFRATVEGIASDGMIGRAEKNIFTQLPFAMSTKIPV